MKRIRKLRTAVKNCSVHFSIHPFIFASSHRINSNQTRLSSNKGRWKAVGQSKEAKRAHGGDQRVIDLIYPGEALDELLRVVALWKRLGRHRLAQELAQRLPALLDVVNEQLILGHHPLDLLHVLVVRFDAVLAIVERLRAARSKSNALRSKISQRPPTNYNTPSIRARGIVPWPWLVADAGKSTWKR